MELIPCTAYFPTLEKTVGGAVQVSTDHWGKAQPIIEAGLKFEIEYLLDQTRYVVSITHPDRGVLACRVIEAMQGNLIKAFSEMIDEYHARESV